MAIKVMSFNIRFDNPKEAEEDKWDARKPLCVEIINKYKPHIIGFQEPHRNQVDDLDAALPGYGWFGKGRYLTFMGINEEHNELNPIFYDKEALTLEASGTFWYSDTPEVPNTQWKCSAFPRIATWGRFAVNGTDQRMCFVNTHFDHESEEARTKAAELLLQQLPSISQNLPTAIVGDLNAGEGSPAVCHLCTELTECSGAGCETIEGLLGKVGTFVGFDKSIDSQIDFIFANKGFKASGYGTIPDERENGRCCSDHRPIMATLDFDADYVPAAAPPPPAEAPEQTPEDQAAALAAQKAEQAIAAAADKAANMLGNLFKGL